MESYKVVGTGSNGSPKDPKVVTYNASGAHSHDVATVLAAVYNSMGDRFTYTVEPA